MPTLSEVNAAYTTVITEFEHPGTGWVLILKSDPQRYFVRFELITVAFGNVWVGSLGSQTFAAVPGTPNLPIEAKFQDQPSRVGGEWYAYSPGVVPIAITEVLQNP